MNLAAICSGVLLLSLRAATSAPAASRASTTAGFSLNVAAICSGLSSPENMFVFPTAATSAPPAAQAVTVDGAAVSKNGLVFHSSQFSDSGSTSAADSATGDTGSATGDADSATTESAADSATGETESTTGGADSATADILGVMSPVPAAAVDPAARRSSASEPSRYPLGDVPCDACQRRIAALVRGPKRPSGVPGSKPSFRSSC